MNDNIGNVNNGDAISYDEFEFARHIPKREVKKAMGTLEAWEEFKRLGPVIPVSIAARIANVSRQRLHQLTQKGVLESVAIEDHHFITELSFSTWLVSPRISGRPKKE